MLGGFLKGYYAAAIEDFKNKKIDKKLFLKMQRVQQTDFNQEFFYKKWKMHSKQCLEYLSTSLKGSLCAACDPIESKRFEKLQVEIIKKANTYTMKTCNCFLSNAINT